MTPAPSVSASPPMPHGGLDMSWPYGFHLKGFKSTRATPVGVPVDQPSNILWRIEEKPYNGGFYSGRGRDWIMESRADGQGVYHSKVICPNERPMREVKGFVNIYPNPDGSNTVGYHMWPNREEAGNSCLPDGITVPISFKVPA